MRTATTDPGRLTRRDALKVVAAGVVSALAVPREANASDLPDLPDPPELPDLPYPPNPPYQPYKGVTLGVQSYSLRDRPLDAAVDAMKTLGLSSCELWQGHVEPRGLSREELRKWRETVPLGDLRAIGDTLTRAGIQLSAYNISFNDSFSDAEIERGFDMAAALGAPCITASSNIKTVARVAPVAARRRVKVGMHNHSRIDPNEFATPANFVDAMKAGPFVVVNLDIGHFTAANFDAVDFLRRHHASIVTLHLKDRRRDQGPNLPFGEGETPIGPVLRLLRDERWPIPANIEYEYKGGDTVEEIKRCLDYCRRQLDDSKDADSRPSRR